MASSSSTSLAVSPPSGRQSLHCDSIGLDTVRIYALLESRIEFVTELGLREEDIDEVDLRQQELAPAEFEGSSELLLAFFRKGVLLNMASLIEGDDDDEEEEDEREEGGEDSEEDMPGPAVHYFRGPQLTWNEKEELKEEDDVEFESEEEDDEEDGDKDFKSDGSVYTLKLRVWPSSLHANLVLLDCASWISTKAYSLRWLSSTKIKSLVLQLADISGNHITMDDQAIVSSDVLAKIRDYEGEMVTSWAVQMFIKSELSPSLCDFDVQKLLGKGAFCNVHLCKSISTKKDYAIKIIRIEEKHMSEPREVGILASLTSPHVVKFFQAWAEDHIFVDYEACSDLSYEESGDESIDMQHATYVLIRMELCLRTLQDYLVTKSREIDAENSLQIFKEIVQGLHYVHARNIIHRDLKPANIFIGKNGKMKIGDFGQSCVRPKFVESFKATPNLGTRFYWAPELKDAQNISPKVDVYPAGVIYFELFNHFETANEKSKTFDDFKGDDGAGITWEGDFSLFKQMISSDPLERPSVDDILDYILKS